MAQTPLLPKKVGWYIQKGSPYFETAQRFTARITETGTEKGFELALSFTARFTDTGRDKAFKISQRFTERESQKKVEISV
jgi:hypothetical protein